MFAVRACYIGSFCRKHNIQQHPGRDIYIFKRNEEGNEVWTKTLGGPGDDPAECIAPGLEGGFIIAGGSEGNLFATIAYEKETPIPVPESLIAINLTSIDALALLATLIAANLYARKTV